MTNPKSKSLSLLTTLIVIFSPLLAVLFAAIYVLFFVGNWLIKVWLWPLKVIASIPALILGAGMDRD